MRITPLRLVLAAALIAGCGSQPTTSSAQVTAWRPLGSWSGHGSLQTESFTGETGSLRVRWETRNEKPAGGGAFRVTIHSAISGRPIGDPIEHRGAGRGIGYVTDDPRVYYAVIESVNVDWSFSVDEGVVGAVGETGN